MKLSQTFVSLMIPYLPLPLNLSKGWYESCGWQPPASLNKERFLTKYGSNFFAERLYMKKSCSHLGVSAALLFVALTLWPTKWGQYMQSGGRTRGGDQVTPLWCIFISGGHLSHSSTLILHCQMFLVDVLWLAFKRHTNHWEGKLFCVFFFK